MSVQINNTTQSCSERLLCRCADSPAVGVRVVIAVRAVRAECSSVLGARTGTTRRQQQRQFRQGLYSDPRWCAKHGLIRVLNSACVVCLTCPQQPQGSTHPVPRSLTCARAFNFAWLRVPDGSCCFDSICARVKQPPRVPAFVSHLSRPSTTPGSAVGQGPSCALCYTLVGLLPAPRPFATPSSSCASPSATESLPKACAVRVAANNQ